MFPWDHYCKLFRLPSQRLFLEENSYSLCGWLVLCILYICGTSNILRHFLQEFLFI